MWTLSSIGVARKKETRCACISHVTRCMCEGDFARKKGKRKKKMCLHFARDALHVRLARRSPGLSFLSAPNLLLFIGA